MQIQLLCVGKVKEDFYRNLIVNLEQSLKKRCSFDICQLPDLSISKNAGKKEAEQIVLREGKRILQHIPEDAYVIALCIDGRELCSGEHKIVLQNARNRGYRKFTYIIGGSLGLSADVVKRADIKLSFSKMTFPHQMMRVMVLEELAHIL